MSGKFTDLVQIDAGPIGLTGPAGPTTNLIAMEGSIAFADTSPFFTPTYVFTTVKGAVWKATGDFVFTDSTTFMEVVLTSFLVDSAKLFNVYLTVTDLRFNGGATFPPQFTHTLKMEVLEKSADKIRFGVRGQGGLADAPIANSSTVASISGFNIESLKFSLLIIAAD